MYSNLTTAFATAQHPGGAFVATVCRNNACQPDYNGFTTALLLRCIGKDHSLLDPLAHKRALTYLANCAASDKPGAYNFYPREQHPAWMGPPLANDADDTAIIALERFKADRVSRKELIKTTCVVLDAYRLPSVRPFSPPWLQKGVFLTWLRGNSEHNPVDCCVNANVVALYASLGLQHWRGYAEACALIEAAIAWAGESLSRARTLCPFYPDPLELRYAVEHAVAQGAAQLEPVLKQMHKLAWAQADTEYQPHRPICSSAYGGVIWYAPILQLVRYHLVNQTLCLTQKSSNPPLLINRG